MKDINGNELPDQVKEFQGTIPEDADSGLTCHGCKKQISAGKGWTMRFYSFDGTKHPVQGPLCPHCSELPSERLPSRRFTERWW